MKKIIVLIFVCLLLCSCSKNSEKLFNAILSSQINEQNVLPSIDKVSSSGNKYYDKMYEQGKIHNKFLLERAYSDNITNYYIPNIVRLTEGDIAIMLLININFKGTDAKWKKIFVNNKILTEYNQEGSKVWWNWLHEKKENRAWIVLQIKKELL